MGDYVPKNDDQYLTWLQQFIAGLTTNAGALDLEIADITPISDGRTDLSNAVINQTSKKAAAKAATTTKVQSRDDVTTLVRAMVRRVVGAPGMTDAIRDELGLNTRNPSSPVMPVGPEVPDLYLEAQPGRITIHFGIAVQGERSAVSKPSWATTCVFYRRKTGEAQFQWVGNQKTSPFVQDVTGPAADYTYIARYQGKKASDLGPESQPATVAARGEIAA